jgi:hypothetical protein
MKEVVSIWPPPLSLLIIGPFSNHIIYIEEEMFDGGFS